MTAERHQSPGLGLRFKMMSKSVRSVARSGPVVLAVVAVLAAGMAGADPVSSLLGTPDPAARPAKPRPASVAHTQAAPSSLVTSTTGPIGGAAPVRPVPAVRSKVSFAEAAQLAGADDNSAGEARAAPTPPPPPPSFEARSRPVMDLSPIALRPADEALILKTLDEAPTHGFRRQEFSAPDLAERLGAEDPSVRAPAVRELKVAILRYARAQRGQRIALQSFPKNWGVRPEPWNPERSFATAVAEDRLASWIEALPPKYQGYQSLRGALQTYRDIATKGGWERVTSGPPLQVGSTGERVLQLRARLAVEDAALPGTSTPEKFDDGLAEALRRYQLRNGLNPTMVVDRLTLNALNQPVGQRIMQILANLERWRWINRDMPATRIEVNIAAAGMTMFTNNYPGLSMRAVAGRPTDQSPMLESRIDSIVINPPWNVPYAIAQKEYWPKERKHPGYLEKHGFRVIPDGANGFRLQQNSEQSALGKLKFDFPNGYGVYLHDTPTHSTFATDSRAQSHGCIRLQNPLELARTLMADMPDWPLESIQAQIDAGDTKRVRLQTPIAVVILYWTAYVGRGQVGFRPDIYSWDKTLLELLDNARNPVPSPAVPA